MSSAPAEISAPGPATAAVLAETRERFVRGFVLPIQIRVCGTILLE